MGTNVESVVMGLAIATVVLFVSLGVAGYFLWKSYKLRQQENAQFCEKQSELERMLTALKEQFGEQGKEIFNLEEKTSAMRDYNQAMGLLMLEEQKSYLYAVALQLDGLVKKNDLLVQHKIIAPEIGQYRNSQLLVLKGSLQQYADSLAVSMHREQTVRTERIAS